MTDTTEAKISKKPALIAYVIREGKEKNRWLEVGAAFQNRDGSFNLLLHANPVNGCLTLRVPEEKQAK